MTLDNVADIYPLSPLQMGMLYHAVTEPRSGVYVQQLVIPIDGTVNTESLRAAWTELVNRHAAFRTAFLWDGLDEPVQVVRGDVEVLWSEEDWSQLAAQPRSVRLEQFLEEDRRRGFELSQAPLMRLKVFRLSAEEHVLVWSYHHILLDGWSKEIVFRELSEIYAARAGDRRPTLPAFAAYREYVEQVRRVPEKTSQAFWQELLGDVAEPTPLRIDGRVTGDIGNGVDTVELRLPDRLTAQIVAFAREHRLTLNTVLHGAWSIVLSWYSGRSDIVYGTTVTNRPPELSGVENTVGVFINTLPVRVRLDDDLRVVTWLEKLQQMLIEVQQHASTPLYSTKRWSGVPADRPLFESLLVFENYPASVPESVAGGLEIGDVRYIEQSNYPLALLVVPESRMRLIGVFDPGRFRADVVTQLVDHVADVLQALVAVPTANLFDVRLPDASLSLLQGARVDYGGDLGLPDCVHDAILLQAANHPERIAVRSRGARLSYGDLDEHSARLASRLASRGVGVDDTVCLLMSRSVDMVTAILGVLRAGAAYVPIDPDTPEARLQLIVEDTGSRLLLTDGIGRGRLAGGDLAVLVVGETGESGGADCAVAVGGTNTAYVLYTSGSTGRPKGVEVTHANLAASTYARFDYYEEQPDTFLLLSSYAFDSSVAGIFWTLCAGGTLVIPEEGIEQNIEALADCVSRERVTHTLCLPSIYKLLLDFADPVLLSNLHVVIVAGERCGPEVARRHFEVTPHTMLCNEYGPTESTVWATVETVRDADGAVVPIGTPIANVSIRIVDASMQTVPRGVVGEICIGGPGVAAGYLNRPQQTAASFISNPDGAEGERLYRTGDLGRVLRDGRLEFLGRVDGQVKVRGYRIEPGEIEIVLGDHHGVVEAAVVAVERMATSNGSSEASPSNDEILRRLVKLGPHDAARLLDEVEAAVALNDNQPRTP